MVSFTSAEKILFCILIGNFIAGLIVQDYYTFIGMSPAGNVQSRENASHHTITEREKISVLIKQSAEKRSAISSDCIFQQE